MVIILSLIAGNGVKSGITLRELENEGWVKFNKMDLDIELDKNQLYGVIYQAMKWCAMSGRRPAPGTPLYERSQDEEYIRFRNEQ